MATVTLANFSTVSPSSPCLPDGAQAITPNDTDTFSAAATVYVGGTGNVTVRPWNGAAAVTFSNVPAGSVLPVRVAGVNATSTTATNLVAVF